MNKPSRESVFSNVKNQVYCVNANEIDRFISLSVHWHFIDCENDKIEITKLPTYNVFLNGNRRSEKTRSIFRQPHRQNSVTVVFMSENLSIMKPMLTLRNANITVGGWVQRKTRYPKKTALAEHLILLYFLGLFNPKLIEF